MAVRKTGREIFLCSALEKRKPLVGIEQHLKQNQNQEFQAQETQNWKKSMYLNVFDTNCLTSV